MRLTQPFIHHLKSDIRYKKSKNMDNEMKGIDGLISDKRVCLHPIKLNLLALNHIHVMFFFSLVLSPKKLWKEMYSKQWEKRHNRTTSPRNWKPLCTMPSFLLIIIMFTGSVVADDSFRDQMCGQGYGSVEYPDSRTNSQQSLVPTPINPTKTIPPPTTPAASSIRGGKNMHVRKFWPVWPLGTPVLRCKEPHLHLQHGFLTALLPLLQATTVQHRYGHRSLKKGKGNTCSIKSSRIKDLWDLREDQQAFSWSSNCNNYFTASSWKSWKYADVKSRERILKAVTFHFKSSDRNLTL